MNKQILSLLIIVVFALPACSSNDSSGSPQRSGRTNERVAKPIEERGRGAADDEPGDEPTSRKPRIGMSKAQIEATYGEPRAKSHTSRGEVWTYWFNRGHAFIPYNFGYRPRMGTFTFGANGRLMEFNYNE